MSGSESQGHKFFCLHSVISAPHQILPALHFSLEVGLCSFRSPFSTGAAFSIRGFPSSCPASSLAFLTLRCLLPPEPTALLHTPPANTLFPPMQPLLLILPEFVFSTELIPELSRSSSIWIPTTMNLSSQEGFAWVLLWAWWRPHHPTIQSSIHPSISPLILSPRAPIHLFTHLPLITFLLFIHLDLSSHLPTDPPAKLPSIHAAFHSSLCLSTRSINIHYIHPPLQSLYGIQTWTRKAGFLFHVVKNLPGEIRKRNHNLWPKVVCVIWVLWQVIRVHRWASGIWNSVGDKVCVVSVYICVCFQGRGSWLSRHSQRGIPRKH